MRQNNGPPNTPHFTGLTATKNIIEHDFNGAICGRGSVGNYFGQRTSP